MKPLVIAHRGDSAHRPENTLASFRSALEVGSTFLECDVQLTKDRQLIVLHDATLDRTTNGRGRTTEYTLEEIRRFSAGFPDRFGDQYAQERIPTLAELLDLARGRARVLIEIKKEPGSPVVDGGVEDLTIAAIRSSGMLPDLALVSFDHASLKRCHQRAPEISRGHLFYRASVEDVVAATADVEATIVMPEKGMLSDELRDRATERGMRLATWVVDDPAELPALARFELYGIGSNRPAALMQALSKD